MEPAENGYVLVKRWTLSICYGYPKSSSRAVGSRGSTSAVARPMDGDFDHDKYVMSVRA